MKTLIFNGSPRREGESSKIIKEITKKINGEYRIVDAYRCNVKPCIDCRYCWENSGCSQTDEMQEIYEYIQECDNVLIISPVYFTELTGQLLAVASRLQTYYCAKFIRHEVPVPKPKKGGIVLVQGGKGTWETAFKTANVLLSNMNAKCVNDGICFEDTDNIKLQENLESMEKIDNLIHQINSLCI